MAASEKLQRSSIQLVGHILQIVGKEARQKELSMFPADESARVCRPSSVPEIFRDRGSESLGRVQLSGVYPTSESFPVWDAMGPACSLWLEASSSREKSRDRKSVV